MNATATAVDLQPQPVQDLGLEPHALRFPPCPGVVETRQSISFLGVELKKGPGGMLVPTPARFLRDTLTSEDLKLQQIVAVAWDLNQALLIESGSGYGKSQTVERMCSMLNWELYYANCHDFDPDVLIGAKTIKEGTQSGFGWVDGIAMQAIRRGGVLFLDEYNFMKGETRGRLHEILDAILRGKEYVTLTENNGEVVPVHKMLRVVAAQNPPGGDYGDRETLDPPQLTRFVYLKLGTDMPLELKLARALGVMHGESACSLVGLPMLHPNPYYSWKLIKELPGIETILRRFVEFSDAVEKLTREREIGADQVQPVYFAFQRDFNRFLEFVGRYTNGDINETVQRALHYYYENRFESAIDRRKVRELAVHVRHEAKAPSSRVALGKRKESSYPLAAAIDPAFEARGLKLFSEQLGAADLTDIAGGLGGILGKAAWDLRKKALTQHSESIRSLGLCGDATPSTAELRKGWMNNPNRHALLASSLGGLDTDEAWRLREGLMFSPETAGLVLQSLAGLNTKRAWDMRLQRIESTPDTQVRDALLISLAGLETRDAWDLRHKLAARPGNPIAFGQSIIGCASEIAWKTRQALLARAQAEPDRKNSQALLRALMTSLSGLDSEEAWRLRESLLHLGCTQSVFARSLAGLNSNRAWEARQRILHVTDRKTLNQLILGVFGDDVVSAVRAVQSSSLKAS